MMSKISAEQRKEWEVKYGKNKLIDFEATTQSDEKYVFVLKKPNRYVMDAMADCQDLTKGKTSSANKVLIANCVLGGDMQAIEDDAEVYLAVLSRITQMLGVQTEALKKN